MVHRSNTNYVALSGVQVPLQPRPATTSDHDLLPLHPKYLPAFEREFRSEPRDVQAVTHQTTSSSEMASKSIETNKTHQVQLTADSIPARAIESSTDVLVGIVESQAKLSSFFAPSPNIKTIPEEKFSPDLDNVKSPSTEFTTSTVDSTPVEDVKTEIETKIDVAYKKDANENEKVCDIVVERESKRYFV